MAFNLTYFSVSTPCWVRIRFWMWAGGSPSIRPPWLIIFFGLDTLLGMDTDTDVGGGFAFNTATLAYYIFSEKGNNHEPPYNPSKKYLSLRSDWKPAEVAKWSGGPEGTGAERSNRSGFPVQPSNGLDHFIKMEGIEHSLF